MGMQHSGFADEYSGERGGGAWHTTNAGYHNPNSSNNSLSLASLRPACSDLS